MTMFAGLLLPSAALAGDGTKASPYTVGELLGQKDALAASGKEVWVKADLKEIVKGEAADERYDCGATFSDGKDSFKGYSYQIFGELDIKSLTNTRDLLILLSYQTGSRPFTSDTAYNEYGLKYADSYEPDELHFSISEIHGALSLYINGYRGYHISSQYYLPAGVVAVKTTASYSMNSGATMTYPERTSADGYVSAKNVCAILVAKPGTYNFVLNSEIHTQWNGGALQAGKSGENTKKDSYLFRFVNSAGKLGFERTSDEVGKVTLDADDEVYLSVSSKPNHFMDNWTFSDGDTKKWIKWNGIRYEDIKSVTAAGDANGDGKVNAADIVITVNFILGNKPEGFIETNADVHSDGVVDAKDVVEIIGMIAR